MLDTAIVLRQIFVRHRIYEIFCATLIFTTAHFYDKHVCATLIFTTVFPTTSTFVRQTFRRQARLCDKHVCANGELRRERPFALEYFFPLSKNRSWPTFYDFLQLFTTFYNFLRLFTSLSLNVDETPVDQTG